MDGFTDNFVGENPEADFLAREKDQLAGLEDDLAPVDSAPSNPVIPAPLESDNENDIGVAVDSNSELNGFDKDLEPEEMISMEFVNQTAFDESMPPEVSEYDDAWQNEKGSPIFNQELDIPVLEEPKETKPTYTISPVTIREEPEKIKIWREEQKRRLEDKDTKEQKAKEELQERAAKELSEWYKQHEEQVAKTRQTNRESSKSAEKELVADVTKMEPGTEWERIAKLCDFNPKTSKSSRDISRMRSIILQVKQIPPIKS